MNWKRRSGRGEAMESTTEEGKVKERPILFSGPMVRAILDGKKTQTRRVIKPQPEMELDGECLPDGSCYGGWEPVLPPWCKWPYQNGMRLWVRETWGKTVEGTVCYRANEPGSIVSRWRPSIHMPRLASRITLEITGVRVERLQEMRRDDAFAEGVEHVNPYSVTPGLPPGMPACFKNYQKDDGWFAADPVASFRSLWQSINGPGSWDASPWVWVIEFRMVR